MEYLLYITCTKHDNIYTNFIAFTIQDEIYNQLCKQYKIEEDYIRIRYVNKTTQDVIDFSTKTLSIDDTHTERFTTRHNINLM